MTREQAKHEVKSRYAEYLRPAKKRGTYICPLCGNGTGATGDGMTVDPHGDRLHLKCFKCGFYGDLVELYQQEHGCTQAEAFTGLYQAFNIQIDNDQPQAFKSIEQRPEVRPAATEGRQEQAQQGDPVLYNYREYYQTVSRPQLESPEAVAYLTKRGISLETARRFWLGFDPEWRSPKAIRNGKNPPASPRLIIPTSDYSYVARDIRPGVKEYAKMKEGPAGQFNAAALKHSSGRPVFVTEGELDALSIIEAGGSAVAMGSASYTRNFLEYVESNPPAATLMLCVDNDDSGRKAKKELLEGLQALGIDFIVADGVIGEHKDPNEALQADREVFFKAVQEAQSKASKKPDAVSDYIDHLLAGEIERFKQGAARKTGFANLDKEAGGIYPGLYVLGAISSLGKTTFIHQMADQMAAAGEHILYFSLEQSRLEMVSKSLARITAKNDPSSAVTSLQIRAGNLGGAVREAITEYRQAVGDRVSVIEGNFNCTVSFIGQYVGRYMEQNQVKPIVIVDYLQIIQGDPAQRQSTKELIDGNVTELKRISRNRGIPIFLISSLNRSNYLSPVDFESFKESGGIEYTADVIWGLQLQAINDELFNKENKIKEKREKIKEAKAENPRKIELVCLKNRYGISSYSASFEYYPQFDLFKPLEDAENDFTPYNGPSPWDKPTRRL